MHISEFSVRQPVLVNLLVILLLVAASITYSYMTKEKFPDIPLDEVWVHTAYPGVSPEEIERLITIPIEDEVAGIDGIEDITSVSSEGYSQIEIDFEAGIEDFPRKIQEVQNRVNRVDDLPEDAETPEVEEEEWTTIAVIASLSGEIPEDALKRLSDDLEDDLLDIPGVDAVSAIGRRDREIWVEVDPGRLESYELSLADVILSLRNKNLDIPGGTLGSGRAGIPRAHDGRGRDTRADRARDHPIDHRGRSRLPAGRGEGERYLRRGHHGGPPERAEDHQPDGHEEQDRRYRPNRQGGEGAQEGLRGRKAAGRRDAHADQ